MTTEHLKIEPAGNLDTEGRHHLFTFGPLVLPFQKGSREEGVNGFTDLELIRVLRERNPRQPGERDYLGLALDQLLRK